MSPLRALFDFIRLHLGRPHSILYVSFSEIRLLYWCRFLLILMFLTPWLLLKVNIKQSIEVSVLSD